MKNQQFYKHSCFLLLVAIVVFLINQLPFLTDMRSVMYDEAWYGNTAYNFAQGDGFLNTAVGSRGNSNFLLPLLTAGFIKLFGCNLLALRLPAVFCGILTLVFLSLCFKQMKVSTKAQIITYAFFVSITLYNTIFRCGRPECVAIMCMAGGICMYLRYKERPTWVNMAGLSIFTYLAACGHPYTLLFFALLGVHLLIYSVRNKEWKILLHETLLLSVALLAILSISWVSRKYNIAEENYIQDRFSMRDVMVSVPVYFKSAFMSRNTIYILPMLLLLILPIWKKSKYRELTIITLVFFAFFPILFSTDLMMVDLGLDYVVLIATVLLAVCVDKIEELKPIYRRIVYSLFVLYCGLSMGISCYYNYKVKYERANTVLSDDLQSIIPQGAKVFGPLRQWPMVMGTDYQSDHTCFITLPQEQYDFIILNSQDTPNYAPYQELLPIDETKMELIYSRETKQYGVVEVYRRVKELVN